MDFYEVLDQVVALLKQRGRASYQALRIQFKLDEESLDVLKLELIEVQELATDRDGKMLVWTGETEAPPESTPTSPQSVQPDVTQEAQPTQAEPSPPPEPPTPDAERRQLTVMFSDLVGSTKLSGQLDPEDYREVLRAYQQTCSDVIHRYDGYIAQHLGDALLVYFGYPQAHEDEGQRAIHTGLGMVDAMKTLNERLEQEKGIRLAIRVGIHTGVTIVGEVGTDEKHELLALGEAPNVASRIQGLAEPDTIAISAATYRLAEGYFDCDDLGSHTLKGVSEPQQVYRVLGESGMQSRLEIAATRGLTPLVGREQEVGLLLDRWNQVKDGQGQVVLLSGEGGIGKSRLVQVLKDHVADEPHTRWECRNSPYYQNTALHPITDLLQRTLQFQSDDTPKQRLEKLEQELRQYRLPLEETVPFFALLLSLSIPEDRYPPLNLSPQRQRQKTLETIVSILLQQAEQQPVLFILEDLHWTDPSTLEFLDLLIDQTPTAYLCVLLTCRPTFQPTWGLRTHISPLALNRLNHTQIEMMAERVAGGKTLPAEVLQSIVERTDGVPLFVEELTKAILESGHLKETNEHYELTGTLPALTIPVTLHDSLMARLDRLVTAKAVAQYASVIGRQFSYELLQTVSQLDEPTLQRELGRLVEAELVYQRGLPPQAIYTFKHALVGDTAYESLLKSTRQQYHQRIAQVLETQFPEIAENQLELVAHHFTEGGLNEQAVDYWYKAGQRASERSAYAEAISHLTKGLDVLVALPDSPEKAQHELHVQIALGPLLIAAKGNAAPEAASAHVRARELCQQIGETPQLFSALSGIWLFHQSRMEVQTARELAEQYLALAQRHHNSAQLHVAHRMLGQTLSTCGELVAGRAHLEQSTTLYDVLQHHSHTPPHSQSQRVACLNWMAWTLWFLGYPDQAVAQNLAALALAQELAHPYTLSRARRYMAMVYQLRQQGQETQEQAEAVIALSRAHGFAHQLAWGTMLRNWALVAQGQRTADVVEIRQCLDAYHATGAGTLLPQWLAELGEAYVHTGQPAQGLAVLDEALITGQSTGVRFYQAELYRLKGELLLAQSSDNQTEAETCFHKAIDVARSQSAKSWELRAATSLARLWQQQGKREEARQVLAEVYDWFTEGFDTLDLKDAKTLLDELK